tara:strand:- start:23 stop:1324 length:1302 start_codon:yes stop_codon:yes gene_type:complete
MNSLIDRLSIKWGDDESPFLVHSKGNLNFKQISEVKLNDLNEIKKGSVVAIIGDYDSYSIKLLFYLIDLGAIVVPLTNQTEKEHKYFFEVAFVDYVIDSNKQILKIAHNRRHPLIEELRKKGDPGLVAFSSGTTGRPKAILHNFNLFLKRFETPRPPLRTLTFLMFDHVGGLNTLFHTLYNKGVAVIPDERTVEGILNICEKYSVEVLPATPTFLRLMLISGALPNKMPASVKIITYGTELMDESTLTQLCALLPKVDFRQTFGVSELGVIRVKSEYRDSLFMKLGGEGVETRVIDNMLQIRSQFCMLGYLNAPPPFDPDGWYHTKDVVEVKNDQYKIVGRISEVINVGGLKFMASDVELVAINYPGVLLVKATHAKNPITGQHVELQVQPIAGISLDKNLFMNFLKEKLQPHMVPQRIRIEKINVGYRFKRM